ncbi:hypothetical protein Tco_1281524 [Tanacetum coccineum]
MGEGYGVTGRYVGSLSLTFYDGVWGGEREERNRVASEREREAGEREIRTRERKRAGTRPSEGAHREEIADEGAYGEGPRESRLIVVLTSFRMSYQSIWLSGGYDNVLLHASALCPFVFACRLIWLRPQEPRIGGGLWQQSSQWMSAGETPGVPCMIV